MSEFRKIVERILDEGDKKIFNKNGPHYNSSKDEEAVYDLLKKKWPKMIMNYKNEDFRSPVTHRTWQIDFASPEDNLYINYNRHIKHGRRIYDPEDPNCQKDVAWLKKQDGEFYKKILHTWTVVDPLKRIVAKQLGWNYVELFDRDEVEKFLADPTLSYDEYRSPIETMQYDSDRYFKGKDRNRDEFGNDFFPNDP